MYLQTGYLGSDGHVLGEVLSSPPDVSSPDSPEKHQDPKRPGGVWPPICVCARHSPATVVGGCIDKVYG
jgi:hypothetical protein